MFARAPRAFTLTAKIWYFSTKILFADSAQMYPVHDSSKWRHFEIWIQGLKPIAGDRGDTSATFSGPATAKLINQVHAMTKMNKNEHFSETLWISLWVVRIEMYTFYKCPRDVWRHQHVQKSSKVHILHKLSYLKKLGALKRPFLQILAKFGHFRPIFDH